MAHRLDLFYCVFYAMGTVRGGKVKERTITFSLSVAGAILLGLFWLYPMLVGLMQCLVGAVVKLLLYDADTSPGQGPRDLVQHSASIPAVSVLSARAG